MRQREKKCGEAVLASCTTPPYLVALRFDLQLWFYEPHVHVAIPNYACYIPQVHQLPQQQARAVLFVLVLQRGFTLQILCHHALLDN